MRELLVEKETLLAKNLIEPHLDDYAVLVSVHYSYISSGVQASVFAQAKQVVSNFSNVPQKIKSVLGSLISNEKERNKTLGVSNHQSLLGYSCSGKVIAVGKKVTTLKTGDYVACLGGDYIHYQDIVCVPKTCVALLPNADFLKKGSLVGVSAHALHVVRLAQLQLGEVVCVMGLGVVGQCVAQLAKESGCTVVGIDLLHDRIQVALASGIEYAFESNDTSLQLQIGMITNNQGFDVTFIAASDPSESIIENALEFTRAQGKIVVMGTINMNTQKEYLHKKEMTIIMAHSAGASHVQTLTYGSDGHESSCLAVRWTTQGNMQTVIQMMQKGTLLVEPLIKREEFLYDIDKSYFDIKNRKVLGLVLKYPEKSDAQFLPATIDYTLSAPEFKCIEKSTVSLGIVGATGIDHCDFFPKLTKMPGISVNAVADYTVAHAQTAARKVGATKVFSHEEKLYKDQDIDAVVITSSDRLHAHQALAALSAGKAVFMSKPMVTNFEEYESFNTYVKRLPAAPLCVDYSYSFSSLIHKIKWELAQRVSPLVIRYCVTRDILTTQSALQRGNLAGSIIDEASALFDLFSFLVGSFPVAVSVEALRSPLKNCFPTDNFSVQLSFSDGSIASLVFTSLGHPQTPKDQMELFFDGKTIQMTDFVTLKGYGISSRNFDTSLHESDRGSQQLLHHFFEGLTHKDARMPFTPQRLCAVAYLTLVVDKLVCQGGGTQNLQ